MAKKQEQLPKLFQDYWMMKVGPTKQEPLTNKENLSEDWKDFLKAIKTRLEHDLHEK